MNGDFHQTGDDHAKVDSTKPGSYWDAGPASVSDLFLSYGPPSVACKDSESRLALPLTAFDIRQSLGSRDQLGGAEATASIAAIARRQHANGEVLGIAATAFSP